MIQQPSLFYSAGGAAQTSLRDDWRTPRAIFDALHAEFRFTVDAAANERNHLLPRYWTRETDAFAQDWRGERVWCNPPYGRDAGRWIRKFAEAAQGGAEIVVALLPARTDTRAFHAHLYRKPNVELRFLPGRLRFGHPDTGAEMSPAPFPSMIAVLRPL